MTKSNLKFQSDIAELMLDIADKPEAYRIANMINYARKLHDIKDRGYHELTHVYSLLAKMFPSWLESVSTDVTDWIVYIKLPTGQVSHHFAHEDLYLFDSIGEYNGPCKFDNHSREQKLERIRNYEYKENTKTT